MPVVRERPEQGVRDLLEEALGPAEEEEVGLDLLEPVHVVVGVAAVEDRDVALPRERAREVVRPLEERDAPADGRQEDDGALALCHAAAHGVELLLVEAQVRALPDVDALGLPGLAPLLLVLLAVFLEEGEVLLLAHQPEGGLLPVVDEGVPGAPDLPALGPGAAVVVVVFEHADPEALVERPDRLVDLALHREAEHGEHRDREDVAVVLARELLGPGRQVLDRVVADLDLRFVRDGVGDGADQAELRLRGAGGARAPSASRG